jgi:hypothetical protein
MAMLTTPSQIDWFHAVQLEKALGLEIKTGLKMSRGSVMQQVNREYGTDFRTKKKAHQFMVEIVREKEKQLQQT